MSLLSTLQEFIAPGSVRRRSLPPFEAGLYPDSALDHADSLLHTAPEIDDIVTTADGNTYCSVGDGLFCLDGDTLQHTYTADNTITALAAQGTGIVAAVADNEIIRVDANGMATTINHDTPLNAVTALTCADDGTIYATIASNKHTVDQWSHALIADDRTGSLISIASDQTVRTLVSGLGWPAGVVITANGRLLVTESLSSSLSVFERDGTKHSTLATNLPFYPGRVELSATGYWLVGPYVRNRATELLLTEPDLIADMTTTISPDEWMVPRLRSDRPHTDALQIGQMRVLGQLKPWAPARSYGLVAHLDRDGRFDWSAHSRADGSNHGITGVSEVDGSLLLAGRGCRKLPRVAAPNRQARSTTEEVPHVNASA